MKSKSPSDPQELDAWIRTVVEGRPSHEQHDAKHDLEGWIKLNIPFKKQEAYRTYCMDKLVEVLDGKL